MRGRLKRREADVENCGIDVAMKSSSVCILDRRGAVVVEQVISTDGRGLASVLSGRRRMRCVLEAGPLAEWMSRLLEQMGHEAVVIDARKATGVIRTKKKTDRLDARNLARMGKTGWYTAVHRKSAGGSGDSNVLAGEAGAGADGAVAGIEHHGQIKESGPRRDVGDVGHPESIRPGGRKVPIHQIGSRRSPGQRTVVRVHLRRLIPCNPAAFMSRATRLRPTRTPCSARSKCTRGSPYVSRDSSWILLIRCVNAASARLLAEGGRPAHA